MFVKARSIQAVRFLISNDRLVEMMIDSLWPNTAETSSIVIPAWSIGVSA